MYTIYFGKYSYIIFKCVSVLYYTRSLKKHWENDNILIDFLAFNNVMKNMIENFINSQYYYSEEEKNELVGLENTELRAKKICQHPYIIETLKKIKV